MAKQKLTDQQVQNIRLKWSSGFSARGLAKAYGVTTGYMSLLVNGLRRVKSPRGS